jgi:NAD(P)H-flavin reductase
MTIADRTQTTTVAEPMMLRTFRVDHTMRETHDTVTLELVTVDGGPDLAFSPGQFTMFYVFGIGEVPLSISGDPAHPERLVHTVRAVGAVTDAICALKPGQTVGIRGPFGTSWPVLKAAGRDVIVVAGGIGLAPVRPAIRHLIDYRDTYGTLSIVYGSRSPTDLLYREDVHHWRSRFDTNVQVTVDRGSPTWRGDVGVVTPLLGVLTFDPANTTAFICGPEIMMRVVAKDLTARGVDRNDIFISLERNVKCGFGICGHCQIGPTFVCKDGPVVPYATVATQLGIEEL